MLSTNNDSGFSYESTEKQKKNASRLLMVELFVFGIAIICIVVILMYLGVIPFPTNILKQPPQIAKGGRYVDPTDPTRAPTKTDLQTELEVTSDTPKYRVVLKNREELIDLFKSWGFYGKIYFKDRGSALTHDPLEKVTIHLTDKENLNGLVLEYEQIPFSTYFNFNGNKADLIIYVSSDIYKQGVAEVSKNMQMGLIRAVYQATHPVRSKEESEKRIEYLNTLLPKYSNDKYLQVFER